MIALRDRFFGALARSDTILAEFLSVFHGFLIICLLGYATYKTAKFWRDLSQWRMTHITGEAGKYPTKIWSYLTPTPFLVTHFSPGARSDDPIKAKYRRYYYKGLLWVGATWCGTVAATVVLRLIMDTLAVTLR
ncbi:MAG: hypothetical protein AAGJ34_03035 [Pseudomonadota bacterium]